MKCFSLILVWPLLPKKESKRGNVCRFLFVGVGRLQKCNVETFQDNRFKPQLTRFRCYGFGWKKSVKLLTCVYFLYGTHCWMHTWPVNVHKGAAHGGNVYLLLKYFFFLYVSWSFFHIIWHVSCSVTLRRGTRKLTCYLSSLFWHNIYISRMFSTWELPGRAFLSQLER